MSPSYESQARLQSVNHYSMSVILLTQRRDHSFRRPIPHQVNGCQSPSASTSLNVHNSNCSSESIELIHSITWHQVILPVHSRAPASLDLGRSSIIFNTRMLPPRMMDEDEASGKELCRDASDINSRPIYYRTHTLRNTTTLATPAWLASATCALLKWVLPSLVAPC